LSFAQPIEDSGEQPLDKDVLSIILLTALSGGACLLGARWEGAAFLFFAGICNMIIRK
jgi:hypothetical protein